MEQLQQVLAHLREMSAMADQLKVLTKDLPYRITAGGQLVDRPLNAVSSSIELSERVVLKLIMENRNG